MVSVRSHTTGEELSNWSWKSCQPAEDHLGMREEEEEAEEEEEEEISETKLTASALK